MEQQPKHIFRQFRNRNRAFGTERRLNMVKTVLEHQPHFPKTLTYEDYDQTMFYWIDKEFDLTFEGKKFNTYKLFSNQRMSEYGQTWQNKDNMGNIDLNFKTITRENNPNKGDNQGGYFNIPTDISWPIFRVPAVDENGVEYIEEYSMRQPTCVNLVYTVSVFTSSYKILNQMNTDMQKAFNSIEHYIFPNGIAIPTELVSTSDESEYTIDDRKYYNQSYQIKVLGYIITEDDYIVKKIPSRVRTQFMTGRNASTRTKRRIYNIDSLTYNDSRRVEVSTGECDDVKIENIHVEPDFNELYNPIEGEAKVEMEEICGRQVCFENTEYQMYVNRKVIIDVELPYCDPSCSFEVDSTLEIESVNMENIDTYRFLVNNEEADIEESDVRLTEGDVVTIEASVRNPKKVGKFTLVCYDTNSIVENDGMEHEHTEEIVISQ